MTTKVVPGTGGRTATWSYDLAGRVELLTDTLGNSIDPHYDTAGRIDSNARVVPGLTGTQTVVYQYDVAGNRTRLTWPGTPAYFVQYTFDALNRMTSASENNLLTLANYTYDALSRRTALDDAPTTGGAHVSYTYTDAGDLTVLDHNLNGSGNDAHFDFTYTVAHQVASMAQTNPDFLWQATGSCVDTYDHNNRNQYNTVGWCGGAPGGLTWNANGNLTSAALDGIVWTYTYDAENRMLTAGKTGLTVTYAYDSLDHRASRAATGQATVFFLGDTRDDEIGDYQPNGTLIQRYIPGPGIDQPIAMVTVAGVRTYFHTDRLGSVIEMSSDLGAKSEGPYTYDPYGRPCGGSGTSTCALATTGEPFRFTGRRLDPDTRLYYYRARFYSFDLGRFPQTDPIGLQADLNLYTYVGNDAVDRADPLGLVSNECTSTGSLVGGNASFCTTDFHATAADTSGGQRKQNRPNIAPFMNASREVGLQNLRPSSEQELGPQVAQNGEIDRLFRILDDYLEVASSRTKWAQVGQAGETAAREALIARGYTILAQQVYVRTSRGLRVTDFLITGGALGRRIAGYEVKVNGSERSLLQREKDQLIEMVGGVVASRSSPLYGRTIQYETYLMYVDFREQ